MTLNINLFRVDKGADISIIEKSEKARNKDPSNVATITALDKEIRELSEKIDRFRKETKTLQSSISKAYKQNLPKQEIDSLCMQKEELSSQIESLTKNETAEKAHLSILLKKSGTYLISEYL